MSTLDTVAKHLSAGGYTAIPGDGEVRFEDASVLGFIAEFVSVAQLLDGWQRSQDVFLRKHASALRQDRRKAWNVYSILLTPERASTDQKKALVSVEEDCRATRKVARAGILTDRDIEKALGVLLPIHHRVSLTSENTLELLNERLSALPSAAVKGLLAGGSGEDFADALVRAEESQ